jgi:hypothetical protein
MRAARGYAPRLDVGTFDFKLAIELDGRLYNSGSEVFETDRWRQNL